MNSKLIRLLAGLAITTGLAFGCTVTALAAELGKSQSLSSPDQVPEGLGKSDWQSLRQAYRAAQFRSALDAGLTTQQAYLKASNTGADDRFGYSVAVSGDTVVVGSILEDSNAVGVNGNQANESAPNSGAVYVFTRSAGAWSQQAYLKASNTGAGNYFGCSVAVSGDTIVVGACAGDSNAVGVNGTQANDSLLYSGAAYVFTRSAGVWSQQAYLKASNTGADDQFGYSVAVSGDTVVVGAYAERSNAVGVNGNQTNDSAAESGAAYVFTRSAGAWRQQAYLKASNTGAADRFGASVAVSGDTVVVGSILEDSNAVGVNGNQTNDSTADSGAAYVFTRSAGAWSQQAYLKASNTGVSDFFGYSVAVSGDTIVVGSYCEDSNAVGVNGNQANESTPDSGAAYVFTRSAGTWSQQAYLKASNTGAGDFFGRSVAISGDTIVTGAYTEDSNAEGVNGNQANNSAPNSGAVYVFTRSAGVWDQHAYFKASNTGAYDYFGASVAVSGATIVVGSSYENSITTGVNSIPNDTGAADESGAAYIFTPPVPQPPVVVPPVVVPPIVVPPVVVPPVVVPPIVVPPIVVPPIVVPPIVVPPIVVPPVVVKYRVTVKSSQAKYGSVTGSGSFDTGSKVALKATAKRGYKFLGWYEKNKLISKTPVLVIKSLTQNRSLVAKFK